MKPQRQLVPLDVLAAALNLPRAWLRREALAGRLPCLRIGRRTLFSVEGVAKVLADRAAAQRGGTSDAT